VETASYSTMWIRKKWRAIFLKFITQEQKKEQTSFRKVLVHIEIHRIILRELGRKVLSSENNSKK
jgi:hypothetical protein